MRGRAGPARAVQAAPVRVLLVGAMLARRVAGMGQHSLGLDVRGHSAGLAMAEELPRDTGADVLVIEQSELDDRVMPAIAKAREATGVAAVVVLYRFCSSATIRTLRAQGCLVARIPADLNELALLCQSALTGHRPPLREPVAAAVAPPRFADEDLANIAAAGSRLTCECPRHLTELLLMVGSFERYSQDCASRTPKDAALHAELALASGRARVVLEAAMERLAIEEGLPLPKGWAA
jgi:hypothetical protein